MNDPTETQLTQSLADHAADAPSDESLLSDVHTRLHRRRRARTTGAVILACAAVATALTATQALTNPEPPTPAIAPAPKPAIANPPRGWHWESYSNVQVQVPDSWRDGSYSHLWNCPGRKPAGPMVGRPTLGAVIAMSCGTEAPPLAERASHLFFDYNPKPGVRPQGDGWTEETRVLAGQGVTVFTDDDGIRRQILDSAIVINGTDVRGCTPSHPLAVRSVLRPAATGGLTGVGEIESVQICAYAENAEPSHPPLLASAELTGDEARAVGEAMLAAPVTTGEPSVGSTSANCRVWDRELLVLKVHGNRGEQEVLVRLTACTDNAFDDGLTRRQPTKPSLQPLLTAVNRPEFMPPQLQRLLG